MQVFAYTAKDKNGELQKGEVEAENEIAAAKLLSSRDLVPIVVNSPQSSNLSIFKHVSMKEKVMVARQLATMINAGLPIAQSLRTLEEQTKNKQVKKMLEAVAGDVEGGSTLNGAFARFPEFFTTLDLTLISAGETSGTLDKTLLRLAEQLEKEQSLMRKVRGAMIYPLFVVSVVVIVVGLLLVYVMPQMEELYKSFNANLPLMTRGLIAFSHILSRYSIFVLIAIIGLIVFIRVSIQKPSGRRIWDKAKISIYGVNELLKKVYMARFSRTLSTLIGSGVPLLDALQITSNAIGNVIYKEMVLEAAKKVKNGVALSEPLKTNPYFPPVVAEMVAVGEKTGELDNMLTNLADYFEEEVEELVKGLSNLIEPVMIVIIGVMLAFIMISIMAPIYQISRIF